MQSGIGPGVRRLPAQANINILAEQLTDALLMAAHGPPHLELTPTIFWISDGSGFWDDANNWRDTNNTARVPVSTDDVRIDRGAANPIVTVRSGNQFARALLSDEKISITGGALSLSSDSEIRADFVQSGGTLNINGLVTVSGEMTRTAGTVAGKGTL
jgi:hypothetical protein